MPDPNDLANRIADKEAQVESSTDKKFCQVPVSLNTL